MGVESVAQKAGRRPCYNCDVMIATICGKSPVEVHLYLTGVVKPAQMGVLCRRMENALR